MRIMPIAAAVLLATMVSAAAGWGQGLDVRALMTPAEFSGAGLAKLTPGEVEHLNRWLAQFALGVRAVTLQTVIDPQVAGSAAVIESRIEGEFNGWDGETIFKLVNGQIWQQSSYAYTYHYAYRPSVMIYRTTGGYKMKVEGVDGEIFVKRLR